MSICPRQARDHTQGHAQDCRKYERGNHVSLCGPPHSEGGHEEEAGGYNKGKDRPSYSYHVSTLLRVASTQSGDLVEFPYVAAYS